MAYQWPINVCFCLVIGLSAQGGWISVSVVKEPTDGS